MSLSDFSSIFQMLAVLNFIALSDTFSPVTIFFNLAFYDDLVSKKIEVASNKLRNIRLVFESNLTLLDVQSKGEESESNDKPHYLPTYSLIRILEGKFNSLNELISKNNDRIVRLKQTSRALNLFYGIINFMLIIASSFTQISDDFPFTIRDVLWSVIIGLFLIILLFLYSNYSKIYNFYRFSAAAIVIFVCSLILAIPGFSHIDNVTVEMSFALLIGVLILPWIIIFILSKYVGTVYQNRLNKKLNALLIEIGQYENVLQPVGSISSVINNGGGTTDTGAREVNNDN